ncbi:MAG: DedA family protein, partial [Bacteroidetes bacterium]
MQQVWDFIQTLTDPKSIITYGGLFLLLFVIYAENGLIIGFFFPGDSLVFLSGLICATRPELLDVNLFTLVLALITAAVLGSLSGYWFGMSVGPPLFERKDSVIFKKQYLEVTRAFYEKHGSKTLIIGRFLPMIRTFSPILAGVIRVNFRTFMIVNVVGAVLWIVSLCCAGYFLGDRFPFVEENIGYIIIGFILVTTLVVMRSFIQTRRERRN